LSVLEPNVAEIFGFLNKGSLWPGSGKGIDDRVAPNAGALVVVEVEIGVQGWKG
jgi:hypothetical protein